MAIIYIFSGLPGVGKSTLAQAWSSVLNGVYLRIDTIEQSFRRLCEIEVHDEGYRLAYLIAADNLNQGINVVSDSCNPISLTRSAWEQVALDANAGFVNIEVICTDQGEHRHRVENRVSSVAGLVLPGWEKVQNHEYEAWSQERIVIDTAGKQPQESIAALVAKLGQ